MSHPDQPGVPRAQFAYEAVVDIGEMVPLGHGPLGERRVIPILGGEFQGPDMRGTVLPGGADRQLVRSDGLRLFDALYEMRTHDGVVLTVRNRARVRDGEPGAPFLYGMSSLEVTAPQGRYHWLNDYVLVGTVQPLRPARAAVLIRVYTMR